MATTVVNSFNIFVDSGRCISSQSRGDNLHLPLSETPISCADNQFLRISLQDFNMVKPFTNVHRHNSMFRVFGKPLLGDDVEPQQGFLDHKNYKNVYKLAENFADKFAGCIKSAIDGPNVVETRILSPSDDDVPTNNVISFTIIFDRTITFDPIIQFRIEDGDIYKLLGGDKITNTNDDTTESVTCVRSTTNFEVNNTLTVTCNYPAQLFTEEHVYLRTDLPSTNLHTESYNVRNSDSASNHIGPSRILGKIPIGDTVCQFHTSTGNEYTLNLKQKNFTMMQLHLTDSHGRLLPVDHYIPASTLGNFNFKCTIKVETMQHIGQQNNQLQTDKPQKSVSARFGSSPLEYLDYGAPRQNR